MDTLRGRKGGLGPAVLFVGGWQVGRGSAVALLVPNLWPISKAGLAGEEYDLKIDSGGSFA
jgi:hypothetical protein